MSKRHRRITIRFPACQSVHFAVDIPTAGGGAIRTPITGPVLKPVDIEHGVYITAEQARSAWGQDDER